MKPHIGVFHWNTIPEDTFSDFSEVVLTPDLSLQFEPREPDGPYAGVEWLLPTAVIVFISKGYFDGFLKEMGKDHYALLKKGINTLYKRFFSSEGTKFVTIGTTGKRSEDRYSRGFSIYAEGNEGLQFKLLVEEEISEAEYKERIELFLNYLHAYHESCTDNQAAENPAQMRIRRQTVLLAYNRNSKTLEHVDPIPGKASRNA